MKLVLTVTAAVLPLSFTPRVALAKGAGPGVYAIIDQVTPGPSTEPDTIRISGVFVVPRAPSSGQYLAPQRGYLYFKMPAGTAGAVARRDWADLAAAAAGTGRVVTFAPYWMLRADGMHTPLDIRVRRNGDTGAPDLYPVSYEHDAGVSTVPGPADTAFERIAAQLADAKGTL